MRLVVDANIIISALISTQGKTNELLLCEQLQLYAPEYILIECQKHKQIIREKSKLSPEEFDIFLALIFKQITLVPFNEFKMSIKKAQEISPDPEDIEYLALALNLNAPLWTNDKQLTQQKEIKSITTTQLLKTINA